MKSKDKRILCLVAAALILLAVSVFLTQRSAAVGKTEYYQTQVDAAISWSGVLPPCPDIRKNWGSPWGKTTFTARA